MKTRNIAREISIKEAVDKVPGCTVESIKPQSDYYIVTFHHQGKLRVVTAGCKNSAVKAVKEKIG